MDHYTRWCLMKYSTSTKRHARTRIYISMILEDVIQFISSIHSVMPCIIVSQLVHLGSLGSREILHNVMGTGRHAPVLLYCIIAVRKRLYIYIYIYLYYYAPRLQNVFTHYPKINLFTPTLPTWFEREKNHRFKFKSFIESNHTGNTIIIMKTIINAKK
jgi:hypothetical protein